MDPRVKYILWRRAQNATFEEIGNELNLSTTVVKGLYTAELDRPDVKGKPDEAEKPKGADRGIKGVVTVDWKAIDNCVTKAIADAMDGLTRELSKKRD